MADYVVLYNPHAGNGRCEEEARTLSSRMPGNSFEYSDMTKVQDYASFFNTLSPERGLILCGGDGTLNRFINQTEGVNLPEKLFYFAAGSGNDFLRDTEFCQEKMPFPLTRYLEDLPSVTVKGKTLRFLNGIGYGIDGYCCEEGDRQRAAGAKNINYTSIAVKGLLFHYRPTNAEITVDGTTYSFRKVWLAPTMHGRFYGGGMIPTPDQDRFGTEHTLSVMVFFGGGRLKTLTVFPSIFQGQHVKHTEMVRVLTGKEITVRFDRPTPLQIDGETVLDVTEYTARSSALVPEMAGVC